LLNPIEWKEPFGMVIIEAMAVGCPVVSFAQGSTPELVAHGKSGFLVDDINEMIHFIGKVESLDRKAVRAHVVQNFSVEVMTEKYIKAYHRVIRMSLLKASTARVSPQVSVPRIRKAPPTTSTPIALPNSFAPSQMSSRSKTSTFVRSEPPADPDLESLS
jgi:hypothetical protein